MELEEFISSVKTIIYQEKHYEFYYLPCRPCRRCDGGFVLRRHSRLRGAHMETSYKTSYIEWSVIIAGTFVACAISVILLHFGAAIGLTQISSYAGPDAHITPGKVFCIGIWLLWVQLLSSLAGGYLAGRMRMPLISASEHERDMRDGVHGLLVWAVSTIAVVVGVAVVASITALTHTTTADVTKVADVEHMNKTISIIFAFAAASTSLICGVASWFAATMGGDHRDTEADHAKYFSFRPKVRS